MPMKKGNKAKRAYFSPAEWSIVQQKAAAAGMRTATFIRHMAVHGVVKVYDNESFRQLLAILRSVSQNINQIAKVANSTNAVYANDIDTLKKQVKIIRSTIDTRLSEFKCRTIT